MCQAKCLKFKEPNIQAKSKEKEIEVKSDPSLSSGWDETNFLGRARDREIRLMKIYYETETEKKWVLIF